MDKLKYIPISTNLEEAISPINVEIKNDIIINVPIQVKERIINFLDVVKEQNRFLSLKKSGKDKIIYELDSKWVFYFVEISKVSYITAHRFDSDTSVTKVRYSLRGVVIQRVVDTVLENNSIVRYYNNYEISLVDKVVSTIKYNMGLVPIKRRDVPRVKYVENDNIGSLYFEVIACNDGIYRVYCGGFITKLDKEPVITYLDMDKFKGSNYDLFDQVVLKIINELLTNKYKFMKFYCHNLGGYDVVFILGVLLRYNENNKGNSEGDYKINTIFRDKRVIRIVISKTIKGIIHKLTICDSFVIDRLLK